MKLLFSIIFSKKFFQKIFAFFLIILAFFIFKGFLGLFLITFIFSYLSLEVAEFLKEKIHSQAQKKNQSFWILLNKHLSINLAVTILYIIFILMIIWLVSSILPKIVQELEALMRQIPALMSQLEIKILDFEKNTGMQIGIRDFMNDFSSRFDFQEIGKEAIRYIQNTSGILLKFFLGLIMSYIFVIDRTDVSRFFAKMTKWNFSFIHREFQYFAEKITSSFGRVFKAQGIIAFVNAVLTTIWLLIIGHLFPAWHFPYIFTLSIIVFIFWFIPVFGTFLSGLPIIIIGYGIGGFSIVIAIIIMISIIHAIEAYILNPKIVSSYVHFPVFITFSILIVAEYMFGMIGLLIWVPILVIIISLFKDFDIYISHIKKQYHEQKDTFKCPTIPQK